MSKQKTNIYGVKSIKFELKDFDSGSRKVSGYFASFDTIDSDNDIIRKGAFSKSIQERGPQSQGNRKIAHLRHHEWEHQIGNLLELKEDDKGLFFVSQLGRSTQGNDALLDYQDGIIKEHSIGFNYVSDKLIWVEDTTMPGDGYWEVTEVKLWEGSAVTFGANEFTPVVDVAKGLTKKDHLAKLNEEFDTIVLSLVNGKGTDERLHALEMRLKVVQQKMNSLVNLEPTTKDTLKKSKPTNTNSNLLISNFL